MIVVLVVASGAPWEQRVLEALGARHDMVVLKRCVDVDELMASATAGQAQVAVVGLDAPGLDLTAVEHLRRQGVATVAVAPHPTVDEGSRTRAGRIGVCEVVAEGDLATLPDLVARVGSEPDGHTSPRVPLSELGLDAAGDPTVPASREPLPEPGRVVAVWGPAGAPGRTTLATALAAELAARGRPTVLVDADPYGGAVAQQLGILDEVSGILAATRLAGQGELESALPGVLRAVNPFLAVVTGLPRPDRWTEVRAGTVEHLLESAARRADVVVDTGFSLEEDPGSEFGARPGRNTMTLGALAAADEVVVVGSPDPVGLSRLARGLVDLRELLSGAPVRVVVNRSRPTLGWSDRDVEGMVNGFSRISGLHFVPDDRPAADRALVSGRTLIECGPGPLSRAVSAVADELWPLTVPAGRGAPRRRRAGRARRR